MSGNPGGDCNLCKSRQDDGMSCGEFDYSGEWIRECGCDCHDGQVGDSGGSN